MFEHKPGMTTDEIRRVRTLVGGGAGSGHHGHAGIPGHRGGSLPKGGSGGGAKEKSLKLGKKMKEIPLPKPPVSEPVQLELPIPKTEEKPVGGIPARPIPPRDFREGSVPPTEWKKVKSMYEAHRQAEALFPHMTFSFAQGDIKTINESMETFTALAQMFPEVAKSINAMSVSGQDMFRFTDPAVGEVEEPWTNGKAYATYWPAHGSIRVNPQFARDRVTMFDMYQLGNNDWNNSRNIKDTIAHEFGHALDRYLGKISDGRWASTDSQPPFYNDIYTEAKKLPQYKDAHVSLIAMVAEDHDMKCGLVDPTELFSSSFAAWARGDRTAPAYAMRRFLKRNMSTGGA